MNSKYLEQKVIISSIKHKRKRIVLQVIYILQNPHSSEPVSGEWVTFVIRKSMTGRMGWKIMTENENMNFRVNRDTIDTITEKIR